MTDMSEPRTSSDQPLPNGRRAGRILCEDVMCSLGTGINISASGARVRCSRRPPARGRKFELGVAWGESSMNVMAVVCWTRKISLFKSEAGVQFLDLTEQQKRLLNEIARSTAQSDVIRPESRRSDELERTINDTMRKNPGRAA